MRPEALNGVGDSRRQRLWNETANGRDGAANQAQLNGGGEARGLREANGTLGQKKASVWCSILRPKGP